MLQLLVVPFSLPSSQMIKKKKSQFLKIIFSMLKKYGKAIEQPQGTLPLHLHSEQMDGQSTESKRRQESPLVLDGPLHCHPQGRARLLSTHGRFFQMKPSSPDPIHGMWATGKGKAILESDGNRRTSGARSSLLRHHKQRALGSPATGWESMVAL